MTTKGYHRYRGRNTRGKVALVIVLVLVLIALSALGAEFILNLAENTVPVFVFTLLLVICTYFLYPLTLYAQEKKKK